MNDVIRSRSIAMEDQTMEGAKSLKMIKSSHPSLRFLYQELYSYYHLVSCIQGFSVELS